MQMSESVVLIRALKEINRGAGRLIKILDVALSRHAKNLGTQRKRPSRLTLMRKRHLKS